jgi:hypothetical protein
MRDEKVEPIPAVNIDLGFATYIPKNYIPIDRHRMDTYRKIAVARTPADLEQIEAELADVYGPLPDEVRLLLDIGAVRIAAAKHDIRSIIASPPAPGKVGDLVLSFRQRGEGVPPLLQSLEGKAQGQDALATRVNALFANIRGEIRIPDPQTVRLRLGENNFEPRTLITVLGKILREKTK